VALDSVLEGEEGVAVTRVDRGGNVESDGAGDVCGEGVAAELRRGKGRGRDVSPKCVLDRVRPYGSQGEAGTYFVAGGDLVRVGRRGDIRESKSRLMTLGTLASFLGNFLYRRRYRGRTRAAWSGCRNATRDGFVGEGGGDDLLDVKGFVALEGLCHLLEIWRSFGEVRTDAVWTDRVIADEEGNVSKRSQLTC
jgi:hypothetical protein